MSKKKKIIILASSVGAVVCILLAVVIYLTLGSKYRSEFFPNTTINGVDCSNLTIPEAEKKILASIEDYTLAVSYTHLDVYKRQPVSHQFRNGAYSS